MTDATVSLIIDCICLGFSVIFFWSTFVVLIGLIRPGKRHPKAKDLYRFAVLVCARNEENVIKLPVKSALMAHYPADKIEVIVLADNCTDRTAERARAAGATVWEKTEASSGKGDVLAWGIHTLLARGGFDAIAVFDADNIASADWFSAMNDALHDGEKVVTGRRQSSNARASLISGWYTIYWDMMNELSNRVRTNLGLSGKLTGTGFAFLPSALKSSKWETSTMVEDVEFTVQVNLRGGRVAYVPDAEYADEQPVRVYPMWRQLRRWQTGGWQVVRRYLFSWLKTLVCHPSIRLFDSFFVILTGMSVAFILLFNILSCIYRLCTSGMDAYAYRFFFGIYLFVFVMGWLTAWASVALSSHKRRPSIWSILTYPVFSLVLSTSVIYTLIFPTKSWKPIPHGGL